MQYTQAIRCAGSLRIADDDDSLCGSTTIISSAITLISQCAQFVEDKAREDPRLGVLSLAVFAKIKGGQVLKFASFGFGDREFLRYPEEVIPISTAH